MYAKNAAGAWGLGEGNMTDSWIWSYGKLRYCTITTNSSNIW
jgi:hypothetical protein